MSLFKTFNMETKRKFSVGGQQMDIDPVDTLDGSKLGDCCIASGRIRIAKNSHGMKVSESCRLNTLFHEITHSVLDTMGRGDLSSDEVFVCTFSSLLTEILTSMEERV